MSRPRIISGINAVHEVLPSKEAGANELFCAVHHPEDRAHGGRGLSRRAGLPFNLDGLGELAEVIEEARAVGLRVFLALNAFYPSQALDRVRSLLDSALPLGPDGLIIADLGLLRVLRARGFEGEIAISVGGTAFNPETVRFYADLGASRVILPRHLRLDELAAFSDLPVPLEIIVLEDRCQFVDGFCNLHHSIPGRLGLDPFERKALARGLFPTLMEGMAQAQRHPRALSALGRGGNRLRRACSFDYRVRPVDGSDAAARAQAAVIRARLRDHVHQGACGLCQLAALQAVGITHFKIASRGRSTQRKLASVRLLRRALDLWERPGASAAGVREAYRALYGQPCSPAGCYFPEET